MPRAGVALPSPVGEPANELAARAKAAWARLIRKVYEVDPGAILAPDALKRAESLKLRADRMLDENDSYGFFSALGDLVVTGPTRTNVNDYRVILVI